MKDTESAFSTQRKLSILHFYISGRKKYTLSNGANKKKSKGGSYIRKWFIKFTQQVAKILAVKIRTKKFSHFKEMFVEIIKIQIKKKLVRSKSRLHNTLQGVKSRFNYFFY